LNFENSQASNKQSPIVYEKFDTCYKPKFDNSISIPIKLNVQIYIYVPNKLNENQILNSNNMKQKNQINQHNIFFNIQ